MPAAIPYHYNRLLRHLVLLVGLTVVLFGAESSDKLKDRTLDQLEKRLQSIDSEREHLARLTFRTGVGNLGWISKSSQSEEHNEWLEIRLNEATEIDQIALVPILWHDAEHGVLPDAFPSKFQIVVGNDAHPEGIAVTDFDSTEDAATRIAPFVFAIEPIQADWVRIEISKVGQAASNQRYFSQLSELLVFNGNEVVSIGSEVVASSSMKTRVTTAHSKNSPVDAFTPYLMDLPWGNDSQSYVAFYLTKEVTPTLTIDLGESLPINGLQLHAADLSENVPKIQHADYAFPKHLIVEGANQADFSDAVPLCEYRRTTIYDAGPIVIKRFAEASYRYVKFTTVEGYIAPEATGKFSCVGFAEIELFSNNHNVAHGKTVSIDPNHVNYDGTLAALTDGKNHFGAIIPYREWIENLARRYDLEAERPIIASALNKRYQKQKQNIQLLLWTVGLLLIGTLFSILLVRLLHLRSETRLKQRFAADLHDELGADLHTIGLLSDLADDAKHDPDKLHGILANIRSNTEDTGNTIRSMIRLQSNTLNENLVATMRQTAERVIPHLEHELIIEGEAFFKTLKPQTHTDLLLFYKECLVNVCRHSAATQLRTRLSASNNRIDLSVSDNGEGISQAAQDWVPNSLQRRARLLGAKVTLVESDLGGTCVQLTLKSPWYFPKFGH